MNETNRIFKRQRTDDGTSDTKTTTTSPPNTPEDRIKSAIDDIVAERQRWTAEKAEMQATIHGLQNDVKRLKLLVDAKDIIINPRNTTVAGNQIVIAKLTEHISETDTQRSQLKEDVSRLEKRLKEQEMQSKEMMEREFSKLQLEIHRLRESVEGRRKKHEQEVRGLHDEVDAAKRKRDEAEGQHEQLGKKLRSIYQY
ncbi:hypothetical protein K505DRAFT_331487 [Melanomma pulvis-pyrius CBS 109.77]|uniref:Uncharacterized protein n=1 Tax=Melanomma pulvis-pyrius CBS 109.77 TaxID=1314802 RepID=A0A6A6XW37_9PLEO|nr:hypothetical protein K505DRAFT_331487 [Melanomma pulvis-pyrius CBS 109.77]